MAARKKDAPKPEPVEKVDIQEPELEVETAEVEPQNDASEPTPDASKTSAHEDGGLAALQAKFDDASRKGYFGPDKELQK